MEQKLRPAGSSSTLSTSRPTTPTTRWVARGSGMSSPRWWSGTREPPGCPGCPRRCGRSSRRPDRLIAVDTGSTDETAELLAAMPGVEPVVSVSARTGFGTAVARGLEAVGFAPDPVVGRPVRRRRAHAAWSSGCGCCTTTARRPRRRWRNCCSRPLCRRTPGSGARSCGCGRGTANCSRSASPPRSAAAATPASRTASSTRASTTSRGTCSRSARPACWSAATSGRRCTASTRGCRCSATTSTSAGAPAAPASRSASHRTRSSTTRRPRRPASARWPAPGGTPTSSTARTPTTPSWRTRPASCCRC